MHKKEIKNGYIGVHKINKKENKKCIRQDVQYVYMAAASKMYIMFLYVCKYAHFKNIFVYIIIYTQMYI